MKVEKIEVPIKRLENGTAPGRVIELDAEDIVAMLIQGGHVSAPGVGVEAKVFAGPPGDFKVFVKIADSIPEGWTRCGW